MKTHYFFAGKFSDLVLPSGVKMISLTVADIDGKIVLQAENATEPEAFTAFQDWIEPLLDKVEEYSSLDMTSLGGTEEAYLIYGNLVNDDSRFCMDILIEATYIDGLDWRSHLENDSVADYARFLRDTYIHLLKTGERTK